MSTRLSVNLNKVALLRNSRTLGIPSVTRFAGIAIAAGAHGITIHPRPDERHIRRDDVYALAQLLAQQPAIEFNIEGNPFHQLMDYARAVKPHQCTLVPDEEGALTSDHGWDLARHADRLRPVVAELRALGIRVSLFMDPQPEAMLSARELGADRIELYTEPYARAFGSSDETAELARYAAAASAAQAVGLGVNAGHDLNSENLPPFLRVVGGVLEVSIGHALTADALEFGMSQTVRTYLQAIASAAPQATR